MKSVAELAWAEDWAAVLAQLTAGHACASVHEPFFGLTVLHWACFYGNTDIVSLLVKTTSMDVNARDDKSGQTPLHWAVVQRHLPCVDTLLRAGAAVNLRTNDGRTPLQLATSSVPRDDAIVGRLLQAGGDLGGNVEAARLSFIRNGDVVKVHEWLSPDTVDIRDEHEKTPLMLAVEGGHYSIVELLLKQSPDLDAQDNMGHTALMLAALAGQPSLVDMLLGQFADMDLQTNDGHTVFQLVDNTIKTTSSLDQKDRLMRCASILQKEAMHRETSSIFRNKLRDRVLHRLADGFDASVFKMALQCDPALGRWMLSDCLLPSRHALAFHELDKVYGQNPSLRKSALYMLLHVADPDAHFPIKQLCLDHPTMRRVLQIKWELFGKRLYIQHVLMYLLLVTCMTVSATVTKNDLGKPEATNSIFLFSVVNFAVVCVALVVGWFTAHLLQPAYLWRIARYILDRKWTAFDPTAAVTATVRHRAQWYLLATSILVTIGICGPLVWYLSTHVTNAWYHHFNTSNVVLLACTGLYFVGVELKEIFDDSSNNRSVRQWCQLAIYGIMLAVYVPMELGAFAMQSDETFKALHVCLGTFLSLALWALSLQFLQVHPTAGALLPMLSGLLTDVWNFILLYGVLQWGLACAYMHILKSPTTYSEAGYETWFRSFTFAYLVLVGQVRVQDEFDQSNAVIYAYGRFLAMVQVALSAILLLNMLVAMMNKRVLDGLQVAKVEALASYAAFILRLETALGTAKQVQVKYLIDDHGHSYLHPAFKETLAKSSGFGRPQDIHVIEAIKCQREEYVAALETLQATVLTEYASWFAQYPQHHAELESSEQLVCAQFNFAMTKPHVNFLKVDDVLRQLGLWVELHLKTLPIEGLRLAGLSQFDEVGRRLAAQAHDRISQTDGPTRHSVQILPPPSAQTAVSRQLMTSTPSIHEQIAQSEAQSRQYADAGHAVLLAEMQRQNTQLVLQLREMEARLGQAIVMQRAPPYH
ncbi:Aste57867_20809 [Aphanomyces stellatus]|uniref:Aste57867_20809 protein n=1 Tax=Aphanomyces stellatus TaxID=120398 RepID=A0A485LFW5_9STRA|nr:hypothetical protein As57867_020741 [Aphanomyces stellatus]VFT97488.1 Aste57867_20809 [Aphanomyces stellatus]